MTDQPEPGPEPSTEGNVGIPLYLQLLWHGEESSRPGPKRGVDLHTIAAAGVRIADAEGIEALSMRRLAAELGFTTMALYRYVESKSELLAIVIDEAFGPPDLPDPAGTDWRTRMANWARGNRDKILAHPWILAVRITEPPLTPHQIQWMEVGLEGMAATGLGEQEKLSAMLVVDIYVRGQTQLSQGMNPGGTTPTEAMALYGSRLRKLIDPVTFPRMLAALGSGALDDDPDDFAVDEFEFGLDSVLDGIAARIARHR